MVLQEWKEASLHKVIETTLDEYLNECKQMNCRVDKCGYIGQILDKVEQAKQRAETER